MLTFTFEGITTADKESLQDSLLPRVVKDPKTTPKEELEPKRSDITAQFIEEHLKKMLLAGIYHMREENVQKTFSENYTQPVL